MSSIFPFPKISMAIKDYLVSLIANKVSKYVANSDTGSTTVEINQPSGIATFTSVIGATSTVALTINNSLITADSCVMPVLSYDQNTNTGTPSIKSLKASTGTILLYVSNNSASPTNGNIVIQFIVC